MRVCCRKAILNMGKSFIEIGHQAVVVFFLGLPIVYKYNVTEHCIIFSVYATAIIFFSGAF